MNNASVIQFPFSYLDNSILIVPECEREIYDIVKESGLVAKFAADYKSRLDFLSQHRERAWAVNHNWFEKLKHCDDLYSMHLARINNMRILYAFVNTSIILLCAFKEAEGGGRRTHSYTQYIPVAASRLNTIKEDHKS